jgi:hypothetical protein
MWKGENVASEAVIAAVTGGLGGAAGGVSGTTTFSAFGSGALGGAIEGGVDKALHGGGAGEVAWEAAEGAFWGGVTAGVADGALRHGLRGKGAPAAHIDADPPPLAKAKVAGDDLEGVGPASSGLREVGSRGVRNAAPLTAAQEAEIWQAVSDLGLDPADVRILRTPSAYSDAFDMIMIGPNAFPPARGATTRSVFERFTPKAVVAHEAGHMITARAGTAFPAGSLLDEFQASIVGRSLPGLSATERFQLLRDAVERARAAGMNPRDLLRQLKHVPGA